ncbi:hypothetical protein ACFL20_10005 [Spirochaetota bacterium]
MLATCSNCKSNYSINEDEINKSDESILACKKCNMNIKIATCPFCSTIYSVTYSKAAHKNYNLECKKCKRSFIVEFPVENENLNKPQYKTENRTPEKRPSQFNQHERKTNIENTPENKINEKTVKTKGTIFNNFNLKELFSICFTSFSKDKMVVSSIGVMAIILLIIIYNSIESFFFPALKFSGNYYLKSFINIFPLSLIFFSYVLTSSIISRITMEQVFYGSKWPVSKMLRFTSKVSIALLLANILIIILLNTVFILFGVIPIVGPLFFSILFLPIYLLFILVLLFISIGFWFYPSIVSYRMTGLVNNAKNFFQFIKKHNLTLIYIVPVLIIITTLIFSAIYLLHTGSFSIFTLISKAVTTDEIAKLFSAMPSNLLRISEFSFFKSDISLYKSLFSDLIITYHIGGFILGIILSAISVILFASFISMTSTLSTHVFMMMERGIDVDDSKKIRILGLLVLFLLLIFLFKKIFL